MVARIVAVFATAILSAILLPSGCTHRTTEDDYDSDAELLYDVSAYEAAESAVSGSLRVRLDKQDIEMRGLWIGLRPSGGTFELVADVDVYASTRQAEEISKLVAEVALQALPRHDTILVRVFWWNDVAGDNYPHPAGAWRWSAGGELLDHVRP